MMNMMVDRLGDEFDQETVHEELRDICPRIQWAFKSLVSHPGRQAVVHT